MFDVVRRVEQRLEQLDQRACGLRIVVDDSLDERLAIGKTGLAQVLCVAAQHRHLLPGQPSPQHQLIESVDLDAALPDGGDDVGEADGGGIPLGDVVLFANHVLRGDLELVDPHRHAVGPRHGERPLLEHHHPGRLQHRQQFAQRRRSPAQVPGELGGLALPALGEHQVDRIVLQLFDDRDVPDCVQRVERLLVHVGNAAE